MIVLVICSVFLVASTSGVSIDMKSATTTTEKVTKIVETIIEKNLPSVDEDNFKVKNVNKSEQEMKNAEDDIKNIKLTSSSSTTTKTPSSTELSTSSKQPLTTIKADQKTTKKVDAESTTKSSSKHRSRRSFTKDEFESFSEVQKVFTESFKRFTNDMKKAETDFNSFMTKIDNLTAEHDRDHFM